MRLTSSGGLFGTADAVSSVLRLARSDGGPALFNLSDRLENDVGPVVISTFDVTTSDPVPLAGLRSSQTSVAYPRDESREGRDLNSDSDQADFVVQVLDAETGSAHDTQMAMTLAENQLLLTQLPTAIDTEGDIVAFLESELDQNDDVNADGDLSDNILRVFDRQGHELTAAAPTASLLASADLQIDKKPLAVSGRRVFFRTPGTFVESLEDGVDGIDGLADLADALISPDGKHVYAIGAGDDSVTVFARNSTTGHLTFVESEPVAFDPVSDSPQAGGGALATSPDGSHLYVRSNTPENTVTCSAVTPRPAR